MSGHERVEVAARKPFPAYGAHQRISRIKENASYHKLRLSAKGPSVTHASRIRGLERPRVKELDAAHTEVGRISRHDGEVVNERRGHQQAINHG